MHKPAAPGWRWVILGLTAAALAATALVASRWEGPYAAWVRAVFLGTTASGLLVCVTFWLWRAACPGRTWIALIIGLGIAWRVMAMPAQRELSDDAARYHWDGKALIHGINPYRYAPADPRLDGLRTDALDQRINHPTLHTVYPPVAELLCALAYLISPGRLTGLKLLSLCAELLAWLLLVRELAQRRASKAALIFAAWCPLLISEGYLPGHVDLLGLPLVVLLVRQLEHRQPWRAGIVLALACLIKPYPAIFIPAAARQLGGRRSIPFALGFAIAVALLYAPFVGAGKHLFSSMLLMAKGWSFNGSLAGLAEGLLPRQTAHLLMALLLILLLAASAWRGRDLLARLLMAGAAWIICTPTLFPWYLAWLIPLVVLRPDPALCSILVLIPLVQNVLIGFHTNGTWQPAVWAAAVEYTAFYGLLAMGAWRGWGMFRSAPAGCPPTMPP
jgi:hypothetical protein